jgi:hypothetical protein
MEFHEKLINLEARRMSSYLSHRLEELQRELELEPEPEPELELRLGVPLPFLLKDDHRPQLLRERVQVEVVLHHPLLIQVEVRAQGGELPVQLR